MKEILGPPLFTREEIQQRVAQIAVEINSLYAGRRLVIICVLKGAFMFFADLLRHINLRPELDFVRIASYGSGTSTSKAISFTKDIEVSLAGKDVLIVEDIVDTGHSMKFLLDQMQAREAASIKLCTLVTKSARREVPVKVDFCGFSIPDGFIVGYGLDYDERYRELPDIRVLEFSRDG